MNVKIAESTEDLNKNWEVISLLRPHLKKEVFISLMTEMFDSGYQLVYIEENGKAVAAIGFRYLQFLFNGKHIYIDDLSTLEEYRGNGYAAALLDYVEKIAKEKGIKVVTLDSGTHRYTAHKLYMKKGFIIDSYHFSKDVNL